MGERIKCSVYKFKKDNTKTVGDGSAIFCPPNCRRINLASNVIGNTDSNDLHLLFQGQLLHLTVADSKGQDRGQGSGV